MNARGSARERMGGTRAPPHHQVDHQQPARPRRANRGGSATQAHLFTPRTDDLRDFLKEGKQPSPTDTAVRALRHRICKIKDSWRTLVSLVSGRWAPASRSACAATATR